MKEQMAISRLHRLALQALHRETLALRDAWRGLGSPEWDPATRGHLEQIYLTAIAHRKALAFTGGEEVVQ